MENPNLTEPKPIKRLFGSKAADIAAGIVAVFLWWGLTTILSIGMSALRLNFSGLIVPCVAIDFIAHLVILAKRVKEARVFIISQILTVVLLPLLAFGLFFGACLLSGNGMSMH